MPETTDTAVRTSRSPTTGRFTSDPVDIAADRFWSKVDNSGECWIWMGCQQPNGYGKLTLNSRDRYAHHVSWELSHGPIPDGLRVLHNCPEGDNPACVNPAHLWLGTQAENIADAKAKGRLRFGSQNPAAKLTKSQVEDIRSLLATGVGPVAVARKFGVSYGLIRMIRRGELWP